MIWKKALKYPMLIVGIIMFAIYISDPKTSDFWNKLQYRYYPDSHTCGSIQNRIKEKIPNDWTIHCPNTKQMIIRMDYNENPEHKFPQTRVIMYRELANSIASISKITNPETMAKLKEITFNYKSPRLRILAKTDGEAIVKIRKTIYEYDVKEIVRKTQKVVAKLNIKDEDEKLKAEEKVFKELKDKKIKNNLKKLPELLKYTVLIKEFR